MTTPVIAREAAWLDEASPALRPGVRVGPPLLDGAGTVHIISDPLTGAYLRVGEREAFLVGRLDGHASLTTIGRAYADRFGRALGPANWTQLLGLLHSHALLDPADDERIGELRERTETRRRQAARSWLHYRLPVPGLAASIVPVARWTGWLFHPVVVVVGTLAGLFASLVLLRDLGSLGAALTGPRSWSSTLVGGLLAWLVVMGHEYGHGVAALRHGARPSEMGLMWRFPLVAPYCKADDTVTLPRARDRVMTAFAGIYVNLCAQVVIAAAWLTATPGGWAADTIATLAAINGFSIVVNLVPVLHLDGYHMLEHALSCLRLQSQSLAFVRAALGRDRAALAAYDARARRIHGGYAVLWLAIVVPSGAAVVTLWYRTLAVHVGALGAIGILVAEAIVLMAFLSWAIRRRMAAALP